VAAEQAAGVRAPRPLAGRSILVTRSREQAPSLQVPLEALGAEVWLLPTLEIGPPDDWAPLDQALDRLGDFEWIVFTSPNAVTWFARRLGARRGADAAFGPARMAAVGPSTTAALAARGVDTDLIPDEHTQEGLVAAFESVDVQGAAVLIPASAIGRTLIDERLAARGATVVRAAAYSNRAPDPATLRLPAGLVEGRLDLIVFASPSAVHHFVQILGEERALAALRRCDLAAIGSTTARALAELNLTPAVQPADSAIPALVEAIRAHYATQPAAANGP